MFEKRKAPPHYPVLAISAAAAALSTVFGLDQYMELGPHEALLLCIDYLDAIGEGCTLEAYAKSVGLKNLEPYAQTLLARESKGW